MKKLITAVDFDSASGEPRDRIPAELGRIMEGEWLDEIGYYAGFFNRGTVFDFLPDDTLVVKIRLSEIKDSAETSDRRYSELRANKERRGEVPRRFPQPHIEYGLLADALNRPRRTLSLTPWGVDAENRHTSSGPLKPRSTTSPSPGASTSPT